MHTDFQVDKIVALLKSIWKFLQLINFVVLYLVYMQLYCIRISNLRHQWCLSQVPYQLLPTMNLILQFRVSSILIYLDCSGRQRTPLQMSSTKSVRLVAHSLYGGRGLFALLSSVLAKFLVFTDTFIGL